MSKDLKLDKFYQEFFNQIIMAKENETCGWESEDFFTSIMLDYLEETGEIENSVICPFRDRGLQLNAYSISDNFENVDLFVSIFVDSEQPQNVSRNEIDAALKRAIQYH